MIKPTSRLLLYFVSIILVILFWEENILLTTSLILLLLIIIKFWHNKNDIITITIGLIFRGAAELICVFFGVWKYTNPTFLIPLWLPILWGIAALLIRRFTLSIEKR